MYKQPRETMRVLPGWCQPFLTWMTGMPLAEQTPLFFWSPQLVALSASIFIAVGAGLGILAMEVSWWGAVPLFLLSWSFTTGGMRRLDVLLVHQSLHNKVTKSRRGNRIIGEIITTLIWRMPYDDNRHEHLLHHSDPCTDRDVDVAYLKQTGLGPGMSRAQFRRYLMRTLVSPTHHARFFWGRIRSNLSFRNRPYRVAMSYLYLASVIAVVSATNAWATWLLIWGLPVSVLFQNATFLYTLSEHRWWLYQDTEKLTKEHRDRLSFGRCCGEPVPDTTGANALARVLAWSVWWSRVAFFHVPYRLFILVGDTVQHDLHHIRPGCDWANSAYVRRDEIKAGSKRYSEIWGTMFDHLYEAALCKSEPQPAGRQRAERGV